jgi:hypothetical protein
MGRPKPAIKKTRKKPVINEPPPEPIRKELLVPGRPMVYETETISRLASIGCTMQEIAEFYGRSKSSFMNACKLHPKFEEAYYKGLASAKMSLRHLQFQHASSKGMPGVNMTIHLSKHLLGEKDEMRVGGTADNKPVEFTFAFTRPPSYGA